MLKRVIITLLGLNRLTKRLLQTGADVVLIMLCFYLAMVLRLESTTFVDQPTVWLAVLPVILITIFAFRQLGLYRAVLRFVTRHIIRAIATGALISAVALFVSAQVLDAPIPRSVPGIYAILLICTTGGMRFFLRDFFRKPTAVGGQSVAIYGAGEAGRQLHNALSQGQDYQPVAFIDDDPTLHNSIVEGKSVVGSQDLQRLIDNLQIKTILLAIPSASRARRRNIIRHLEHLGLEVKTIPGMNDIVSGRATFSELRQVTPDDLLGRDPVPPRSDLMGKNITGKVVLVSGAGGSIGSELCRQILEFEPSKLVLLEVSEFALYQIATELREVVSGTKRAVEIEPVLGSVQNPNRVRATLQAFGVQTIYHAAAYKHVVLVEENVIEGLRNNVFGTKVIADAAAELGVESFILISTDKAVRPTNVMGASKRMAELVCQVIATKAASTTFSMVRFGNVLGSSGSVIPRFEAQIEAGGPVTVTHREITRYFMTIPEAAQLVIQAGAMAKGGDVFVLDMGEPVKIFDLAQSMICLKGLKPYLLERQHEDAADDGDIGIDIIGLQKGEKLYEELLVGNDPLPTDHPLIMTAREVTISEIELSTFMKRLQTACMNFDFQAIRSVFLDAPLDYQPKESEIHDLMWQATQKEYGSIPEDTVSSKQSRQVSA